MTIGRHGRIPLAPEGLPFIIPFACLAVVSALLGWWVVAVAMGLAAICMVAFFRDPERVIPALPGAVVSPADGRVMGVVEEDGQWRISIFLSVFNVHVNRAPVGGKVSAVTYTPGQFRAAYRQEASSVNEANSLTLEHHPYRIVVKQIAGLIARRIVCRVQVGAVLEKGQRYGLIRFGSRTDLVLPREAEVRIRVGDRVRGGETVLAILKESDDI
jgi:phosphatidylserine decarboxylase